MTATVRRHAGRCASALVLLPVLAAAAVFLVPTLLGYELYAITTGSMAGTVDPGGLVIAERVPVAALAVGDVVTYQPPADSGVDHLVTHRITEIGADELGAVTYRTQGDANGSPDPWTFTMVSGEQPRMIAGLPLLGRPVLWLADPDVRRLAIGGPAVAVALLALRELVAALRPARRVAEADVPAVPAPALVLDLDAAAPAASATPARRPLQTV